MTCIVGIDHEGDVWIGGDSAGVGGWTVVSRADPKVFRVGEFVYGIAGSFRGGNVLRYGFTPPERYVDEDTLAYMNTRFIDGLKEALKKAGAMASNGEGDKTGNLVFLMGYRGGLYGIHENFQVALSGSGYAAIGCGDDFAIGALYATAGLDPEARARLALEAAAEHSIGVRAPFVIEQLGKVTNE